MSGYRRALRAEALKLRHTLAAWVVVLLPGLVITLQWYLTWDRMLQPHPDPWPRYQQGIASIWAVFMLPLYIALQTAFLGAFEHQAGGWKLLFALPVSRRAIYGAKLAVGFALTGAASLVIWAGTLVSGMTMRVLKPGFGFDAPAPWADGLLKAMLPFLAAWLLIALHTWLAARFRSFAVPLGTGVGGTFLSVFATGGRFGKVWPWSLPVDTLAMQGQLMPLAITLGVTGGVLVALLGMWDVARRDAL